MSTLRSSAGLFTFDSYSLVVGSAVFSDFDLLSGELATVFQVEKKKKKKNLLLFRYGT